MSLQKYIAQHISQDTGQPNGARRMLFGPESVYLAKDVDAALAAERQANTELAMRERKAEADLADAQHALMLANSNAAAFQRVAEQRQGEIERLRRAVEWLCGCLDIETATWREFHRDAPQFNDLIKPTTAASNG